MIVYKYSIQAEGALHCVILRWTHSCSGHKPLMASWYFAKPRWLWSYAAVYLVWNYVYCTIISLWILDYFSPFRLHMWSKTNWEVPWFGPWISMTSVVPSVKKTHTHFFRLWRESWAPQVNPILLCLFSLKPSLILNAWKYLPSPLILQ